MQILKISEVSNMVGLSRSTIYAQVESGVFPPPVKIGRRASGWLAHEVEAVLCARAREAGEAELRKVVNELITARFAA